MRMKSLYLLGASLLLATACGKKDAADVSPAAGSPAVPAVQTKTRTATEAPTGSFSAEVEAQAEPNAYRVHLRWPALSHSETWIVQRSDEQGLLKMVGRFDGDITETLDTTVTPGAKYRYELAASEESNWHRTDKLEITIPRDFEVRGVMEARDLQTNRLYLRAGSTLRIGERTLQIVADEIIAEGGVIETFAENQTAPPGAAGRSGGHLTVRARTGHGSLLIQMRGENGGPGTRGAMGASGARGADGANGEAQVTDPGLLNSVKMIHTNWGGPFGTMVPIGPDPADNNPVWKAIETCVRAPQPGGLGVLGGAGQDGIPGGAGGASGTLNVQVERAENLMLQPTISAGLGGIGRGGDGGPRGPNGSNGAVDRHGVCPPAVSLPPGNGSGPSGKDVKAGDGAVQSYCLKLSGQTIGQCGLN